MGIALGIDTGGTCTDAVLLGDDARVIASAKALTSHGNLIDGLSSAVQSVIKGQDVNRITLVSVSTTLATNALVEGRGQPVGLVLVGYREQRLDRARLREALAGDPVVFIDGGHGADGVETAPVDMAALRDAVLAIDARVQAWAVSAMFAVRNPAHELAVAKALTQLTGKPVSLGHRLSASLDAPRRALTALLNARLVPAIVGLLDATSRMLDDAGIHAPLMVVKGDGTLIDAALARELPVETILSGPAASVVGARFLVDVDDCVVVDIGGTTSDMALIRNGRLRLSADGATVGGWATMVEAIEIASIGLGGDSQVLTAKPGSGHRRGGGTGIAAIGPRRVMSLSQLASQHDDTLARLERELERGHAVSHDGQFLVARPVATGSLARTPGTATQRALLQRVRSGVRSLGDLFADGSSPLAVERLERDGHVLRASFTPTDACHVLGVQSHWDARAAWLGARLVVRGQGGEWRNDDVIRAFCKHVTEEVSRLGAVAVASMMCGLDRPAAPDGAARARWLDQLIRSPEGACQASRGMPFTLQASLDVPLVGLGASAPAFHPLSATMLGSRALLPRHGEVANAVGAVVGHVRQEAVVTLLAAGRDAVRALLPDGPRVFDTLEAAVEAATLVVRREAYRAASRAGAEAAVINVDRDDTVVVQEGQTVFLQSVVRAVAIGRPPGSVA